MRTVSVYGLGVAGVAAAKAFAERGIGVRLGDDSITDDMVALADAIDSPLHAADDARGVESVLRGADALVPAPGIAPNHPVIVEAHRRGIAIRSEIDIAYEWEQARPDGPRPIVAVTGTDGKTTTTMLVAALIRESGKSCAEVGNTDVPFIAAVNEDVDAFVVECSSFRLAFTQCFRADASIWLNIAPDHLDWHGSFEAYSATKARIWSHDRSSDVAVLPFGDALIEGYARSRDHHIRTFGLIDGDYRVEAGSLVGPGGPFASVASMWRSMPHDITNSLAACAAVLERGLVSVSHIEGALANFQPASHRIEHVGEFKGSAWFDDSKATSPHAALTAIRAFDRVVLIAGGKNKELDLSQLASEPHRMQGVVAIGASQDAIVDAFTGVCTVVRADSMETAVAQAAMLAVPGVSVLLSPGCTSYDWYANYKQRGDDFVACVEKHFSHSNDHIMTTRGGTQ
jgi:UDP-N-acetylmuramoylalanine--D-glutamate ligase